MWLASVSLRNRRGIVATGKWDRAERQEADRLIGLLLEGLGDETRERRFRMNITLCHHRALREDEMEQMGLGGSCAIDIAGAPLEVLWSRGVKESASAMPCANPRRRIIDLKRPDLWIPEGCGKCESCEARGQQFERDRTCPSRCWK